MDRLRTLPVAATAIGAVGLAAVVVLGPGPSASALVPWLWCHGGPVHALVVAWLALAPVPLVAAALLRRRTPWPWVMSCTLQLVALVLPAARFPHLLSPALIAAGAAYAAIVLASIVTAFPPTRPGSEPEGRRAPGSR